MPLNVLPFSTPVGEIDSVYPANIMWQTAFATPNANRKIGESCDVGCLLIKD